VGKREGGRRGVVAERRAVCVMGLGRMDAPVSVLDLNKLNCVLSDFSVQLVLIVNFSVHW